MAIVNEIVFLILLLKAILFATASTAMTKFEREWNLTLSDLIIEDELLGKDNIVAYAHCHDTSSTERECILIYEFLHPEGFIFKNKCYISFHNDIDINRLSVMKIRAASKGKVVMSYINDYEATWSTVYRVVDTSTCKYHESKFPFNVSELNEQLGDKIWEGNVFLHKDGTLDAFLAQPDLCKGGARCRVNIGTKGQLICHPSYYLPSEMLVKDIRMFPFSKTPKYNEFFAVVKDFPSKNPNHLAPTAFKLLHAGADSASPKTVLELSLQTDVLAYDVDNSKGVLGICWSKSKSKNITAIECRQYNIDDKETVTASFELPYSVKTLKVKNTWANEELLLLTDECEDDLCENGGRYYIRAVNRQKPYSANMEISDLNCLGNKKQASISIFNKSSKGDQICVSVFCRHFVRDSAGKSHNNVKLARQCFPTNYIHEAL